MQEYGILYVEKNGKLCENHIFVVLRSTNVIEEEDDLYEVLHRAPCQISEN